MQALSSSDVIAGGRYFGDPKSFSEIFAVNSSSLSLDSKLVDDYWNDAETGY